MESSAPNPQSTKTSHITDYLANERTFLAWIRTSIAVISLGFVVAKFSVWLRQLAVRLDPQVHTSGTGASLIIGVVMMATGGVLAALSAQRYHAVNRDIESGQVTPSRGLIAFITVMVAALAIILIAYMISTSTTS